MINSDNNFNNNIVINNKEIEVIEDYKPLKPLELEEEDFFLLDPEAESPSLVDQASKIQTLSSDLLEKAALLGYVQYIPGAGKYVNTDHLNKIAKFCQLPSQLSQLKQESTTSLPYQDQTKLNKMHKMARVVSTTCTVLGTVSALSQPFVPLTVAATVLTTTGHLSNIGLGTGLISTGIELYKKES